MAKVIFKIPECTPPIGCCWDCGHLTMDKICLKSDKKVDVNPHIDIATFCELEDYPPQDEDNAKNA